MSRFGHRVAARAHRSGLPKRYLSRIISLCNSAGIVHRQTAHGYQFMFYEYVINWAPTTNSVSIQYRIPGDGNTVSFTKKGSRNTPRILVALNELVELSRSEGRCHRGGELCITTSCLLR